ncbi:MAG: hypothetical protein M3M88_00820 [Thermoproteota archaeon]|nr:hypothetical protein [Thermoproteota archaeon]
MNAVTDSDYITSIKAINTSIDVDVADSVVRFFAIDFALEPKAQSQDKDHDKGKGGKHILVC